MWRSNQLLVKIMTHLNDKRLVGGATWYEAFWSVIRPLVLKNGSSNGMPTRPVYCPMSIQIVSSLGVPDSQVGARCIQFHHTYTSSPRWDGDHSIILWEGIKKFKHFGSLWHKGLNKSYGWCNAAWCIVLYRSCRWSCRLYKCRRRQAQLQTPKCGRSPLSVEKQVAVRKVVVERTTSCPLYLMFPSITSHSPSIQTLELSWEHRVPSFTLLARAKKKS